MARKRARKEDRHDTQSVVIRAPDPRNAWAPNSPILRAFASPSPSEVHWQAVTTYHESPARYELRPYVIICERRLTDYYRESENRPRWERHLQWWGDGDGLASPKVPDRLRDAPITGYVLRNGATIRETDVLLKKNGFLSFHSRVTKKRTNKRYRIVNAYNENFNTGSSL